MNKNNTSKGAISIQLTVLPMLLISSMLVTGCDNSTAITAPEPERIRLAADQNYVDFGSHVIHVNAMITNELTPAIAATYDIVRSDSRAMLNVVILEKDETPQGNPALGSVAVKASNLTGQVKSVDVRKVEDGGNIYYIGDVSIDNQERLSFQIDVTPDGLSQPMRLVYSHQFYTD